MNSILCKEMENLVRFLEKFYFKKMNIYTCRTDDFDSFALNVEMKYVTNIHKTYPVHFISTKKFFKDFVHLNIEFSCYQSDNNKIVIDKEKMLSDRILKVIFYCKNIGELEDAFHTIFIPRVNRYKKHDFGGPIEFTMCVPPNNFKDPNYKNYLKEWFKFCEENPEYAANRDFFKDMDKY